MKTRAIPPWALLVMLASLLLHVPALLAASQDPETARVVFLRGTVTASDPTTHIPRLLRKNSRLEPGDVVETGPKGLVKIVFPDKSLIFLKASSKIRIEAMNYQEDQPKNDAMVTEVLKGGLRALSGAVGKRNPDKVRYTNAVSTIGIRGTAIRLEEIVGQGWLAVFEIGHGYAQNLAGTVEIPEGYSLLIRSPDSLGTPSPDTPLPQDPAQLALQLASQSPKQVAALIAEVAEELNESDALLLIAMLQQLPASAGQTIPATIEALSGRMPTFSAADIVTLASLLKPELSPAIYRASLRGGLDVAIGLDAAISGILNDHPDRLLDLIDIAVENGLSRQQALEIALNMQGMCR